MTATSLPAATHATHTRTAHATAGGRSGVAPGRAANGGADFAALLAREIGAVDGDAGDAAGTIPAAGDAGDAGDAARTPPAGTDTEAAQAADPGLPKPAGATLDADAASPSSLDTTRVPQGEGSDTAPANARLDGTTAPARRAGTVGTTPHGNDETAGGDVGAATTACDLREPAPTPPAWGRSARPPAAAPAREHASPVSAVAAAAQADAASAASSRTGQVELERAANAATPTLQAALSRADAAAPGAASLDPSPVAASGLGATEAASPAPAAPDAAPVAEARLPVPPHAPGFAAALGSQLRLWVREGLQHARLQLNPVELGPVTVRIELDGTRASVDFVAQQAATRSAIEAALPALAGALRESGLTLAGGGVFEQPRDRSDDTPPQPGGASGGAGHPGAARAAAMPAADTRLAPVARGLVDLVA